MTLGMFTFFYYFVFIWGGIGMLFIGVAAIREMILQFKRRNELPKKAN